MKYLVLILTLVLPGCFDIAENTKCINGVVYYYSGHQLAPAFNTDSKVVKCYKQASEKKLAEVWKEKTEAEKLEAQRNARCAKHIGAVWISSADRECGVNFK